MNSKNFSIDAEISRASTAPGFVYHDPEIYRLQRERIFARSWHWVEGAERVKATGHVLPFTLLDGCLDEPLFLSRAEDGALHCLSNVCTHRGALVVEGEAHTRSLRCRYHGRRYELDGRFHSMPEFDGVEGFPTEADDLPRLALHQWGPLSFTSIEPSIPFDDWIAPVRARIDGLPVDRLVFDRAASHDYHMRANWALYVDNFLEEFHIPYVHQATLTDRLDYASYRTECFRWGNVQFGMTKPGEFTFDLPAHHPDHGQPVGAYYFWLFPNVMLNFYGWGLSLNVVVPLAPDRTRVSFRSYVWDESLRESGAGADLHRVEMEDEEVVESVQRGVQSRLYERGRFSPRREVGTHHFHRLLAETL
ncbi:MAG: aromatic ring-hydroxylating oxygenase subunit alpha [Longimicrobiales bacterium]